MMFLKRNLKFRAFFIASMCLIFGNMIADSNKDRAWHVLNNHREAYIDLLRKKYLHFSGGLGLVLGIAPVCMYLVKKLYNNYTKENNITRLKRISYLLAMSTGSLLALWATLMGCSAFVAGLIKYEEQKIEKLALEALTKSLYTLPNEFF